MRFNHQDDSDNTPTTNVFVSSLDPLFSMEWDNPRQVSLENLAYRLWNIVGVVLLSLG